MRAIFHHVNLKRIIHSRYYDLVIADVLKSFAFGMISLFIPLFLIKKSFPLEAVLFFYLAFYVAAIFGHYFLLKTISRIGIKQGLIIGYFCEILVYLILYNHGALISVLTNREYLALLLFPFTAAIVFYWTAHHIYFFISSHSEREGEKLGLLYSIPNLLSIFAPFAGGAIITFFGFRMVYVLGILLIFSASVVLFFSRKIEADIKVSKQKIFDLGKDSKNWLFFIDGANYFATSLVWPLYMFYISINFLAIGVVYFFCNIAYALACFLGGKISDQVGARKLGRIGAIGHSVSLALRAFSASIFSVTFSLLIGGTFSGLMQIALDSGFYKHSHENMGNAMMNREFYMHLGRIFLLLILIAFVYLGGIKFALTINLLLAALLTFVQNFFIKKDKTIID